MTEKQIETALKSNRNLFITGAAGTGKSYLLSKYIENNDNVLVCAPTGIAALNIGGETMHKVFHIPVPAYEAPSFAKNKKGALTTTMLKPIIQADTIIIDEISMARNDAFSFMIKVIRKAEKIKGSKIRIIVCGDFNQLPPVVKKEDIKLMKKFNFDESGFVFTTQEWKSCNFKVVELKKVKRQNNQEFINELNKIRNNDTSNLNYWKQFVNDNPNYNDSIVICGTNAEADRINQEYLNSLPGDLKALKSVKEGRCSSGYIDDIILVKENCKIIFTVNDVIFGKYKNGSFGTLKYINNDSVTVEVETEKGKQDIFVKPHKYTIYTYNCVNGKLNKKEIGAIVQYPFKVAKAITIHKSQGQTFERAIISPEIFASGQLYVALSRISNPKGLILLNEITKENVIVDKNVIKFYKNNFKWEIKKVTKIKTTSTKKKKTKSIINKNKKTNTKQKTVVKSRAKQNTKNNSKSKVIKKNNTTKKLNKKK